MTLSSYILRHSSYKYSIHQVLNQGPRETGHLICLRAQVKAEVRQERKSSSRIVLFREKAMTPLLEDQSHHESSVPRGLESWDTRARGIFSCCFISLFCDSRGWVLGLQPYGPQTYIPSSPCYIWFSFFVCLFVFFCFLRQGLSSPGELQTHYVAQNDLQPRIHLPSLPLYWKTGRSPESG